MHSRRCFTVMTRQCWHGTSLIRSMVTAHICTRCVDRFARSSLPNGLGIEGGKGKWLERCMAKHVPTVNQMVNMRDRTPLTTQIRYTLSPFFSPTRIRTKHPLTISSNSGSEIHRSSVSRPNLMIMNDHLFRRRSNAILKYLFQSHVAHILNNDLNTSISKDPSDL